MSVTTASCPSCGAPVTGAFCRACGAAVGAVPCVRCGAPLPSAAAYCPACGHARNAKTLDRRLLPVLVGGVAVVAAAVALAWPRGPAPEADLPPAAAAAAAPDISRMSPEERFDRLYRRVMQAARTGDTASRGLAPMALGAYEMLDSADADTKYHAALIRLHVGDAAGAAALGDSILVRDSAHLLGYVARGMAFRWQRDSARLPAVYAAFRRHAARELAAGRPEYAEHRTILEEFRQAAERTP